MKDKYWCIAAGVTMIVLGVFPLAMPGYARQILSLSDLAFVGITVTWVFLTVAGGICLLMQGLRFGLLIYACCFGIELGLYLLQSYPGQLEENPGAWGFIGIMALIFGGGIATVSRAFVRG